MPFYIDAMCKRNLANASANASLNHICERAYSSCRNDLRVGLEIAPVGLVADSESTLLRSLSAAATKPT